MTIDIGTIGQIVQLGLAVGGAVAFSATFLIPGFYKARSAARATTASAQSEAVTMIEANNRALRQENADLRDDLAGCEREYRRLRRLMGRDDAAS